MNEEHFSESVTFNAVGLDKVVEQTRQARLETDQLAASQKKFADQIAKRLGYENHAQAVARNRGGLPPTGAFGSQQRAGYAGQSQGLGQGGIGQGGTMRFNQPIRIQAQNVILQVQSMTQQEQAARRNRYEEHRQNVYGSGGGGIGGNVIAAAGVASVLQKNTAASNKQLVESIIQAQRPKNGLRMIPDQGKASLLATAPPQVQIDPKAMEGLSASARAKAMRDMMTDPRTDARERFRAAVNYKPDLAFETRIASSTDPENHSSNAFKLFEQQMKASLKTLTVEGLKELATEIELPERSKYKRKDDLVNALTGVATRSVEQSNLAYGVHPIPGQGTLNANLGDDASWRRQYAAEMKQLTSLSAMMRRSYEQARIHLDKFGQSAKAWATSPEMQSRLNRVRDRLKKDIDPEDVRTKAGYAALGMVGLGAGMTWQGLQKTVTGQQFNNEIGRLQHELANAFGPALRKATELLGQFTNGLADMSPRQQRNLMYAGVGVAGYGALKAAGMGGLVEKPIGWAAGLGMLGAAKGAPLLGAGASWLGGMAAAGAGKAAAAGLGASVGAVAGTGALGYLTGRALSPYVFSGTQGRMDAFDRRSRGQFTEQELHANQQLLGEFNAIDDPQKRIKAQLAKEKELLKEKEKIDSEYSTFGKLAGDITIAGYSPFGSHKRRSEEAQARLQLVEQQRIGNQNLMDKKNKENLAGGGFEGFLDTYRRTEEAVGRIDPGLQGGVVQRADGGDQEKLAAAADKLAAAADKLQAVADKDAAPKADGKLQRNW